MCPGRAFPAVAVLSIRQSCPEHPSELFQRPSELVIVSCAPASPALEALGADLPLAPVPTLLSTCQGPGQCRDSLTRPSPAAGGEERVDGAAAARLVGLARSRALAAPQQARGGTDFSKQRNAFCHPAWCQALATGRPLSHWGLTLLLTCRDGSL